MRPMLALLPLLALLGCQRTGDGGKVLANVAGEKITEAGFKQALETAGMPSSQMADLLSNPLQRERRQELLRTLVETKTLVAYGKSAGLDRDPKVGRTMEQVTARVYFQFLIEQRGKAEPTEAQLRELYDRHLAKQAKRGSVAGFPKFEDVQPQLREAWVQDQIQQDVAQKIPVTFADGWKGSQD